MRCRFRSYPPLHKRCLLPSSGKQDTISPSELSTRSQHLSVVHRMGAYESPAGRSARALVAFARSGYNGGDSQGDLSIDARHNPNIRSARL